MLAVMSLIGLLIAWYFKEYLDDIHGHLFDKHVDEQAQEMVNNFWEDEPEKKVKKKKDAN